VRIKTKNKIAQWLWPNRRKDESRLFILFFGVNVSTPRFRRVVKEQPWLRRSLVIVA